MLYILLAFEMTQSVLKLVVDLSFEEPQNKMKPVSISEKNL